MMNGKANKDTIVQMNTTIPQYAREHGIDIFRVNLETIEEFTQKNGLEGVTKCGPENFTKKLGNAEKISYIDTIDNKHFIRAYYARTEQGIAVSEESFKIPGGVKIKNITLGTVTLGIEEISTKSAISFIIILLCFVILVYIGSHIADLLTEIMLP